jgi:hypothetical protein
MASVRIMVEMLTVPDMEFVSKLERWLNASVMLVSLMMVISNVQDALIAYSNSLTANQGT